MSSAQAGLKRTLAATLLAGVVTNSRAACRCPADYATCIKYVPDQTHFCWNGGSGASSLNASATDCGLCTDDYVPTCSVEDGSAASSSYPCLCGANATCSDGQVCSASSGTCEYPACDVGSGLALSSSYPCGCGSSTCQQGQACTAESSSCDTAEELTLSWPCPTFNFGAGETLMLEGYTASGSPIYKGSSSYIWHDPSCDGGNATSAWMVSSTMPSLTATADLDGDGICAGGGFVESSQATGPPSGTWKICCSQTCTVYEEHQVAFSFTKPTPAPTSSPTEAPTPAPAPTPEATTTVAAMFATTSEEELPQTTQQPILDAQTTELDETTEELFADTTEEELPQTTQQPILDAQTTELDETTEEMFADTTEEETSSAPSAELSTSDAEASTTEPAVLAATTLQGEETSTAAASPDTTAEPEETTAETAAATTASPTGSPTQAPTEAPTASPSAAPTAAPTATPTQTPTATPTQTPTEAPTQSPTAAPTRSPTGAPTPVPTPAPTSAVSQMSTDAAAGATAITVADESLFDIGDTIAISDGTNTQMNVVIGKGSLTLRDPLEFSFAAADTMVGLVSEVTTASTSQGTTASTTSDGVMNVAGADASNDKSEASSAAVVVVVACASIVVLMAAVAGGLWLTIKRRKGGSFGPRSEGETDNIMG